MPINLLAISFCFYIKYDFVMTAIVAERMLTMHDYREVVSRVMCCNIGTSLQCTRITEEFKQVFRSVPAFVEEADLL